MSRRVPHLLLVLLSVVLTVAACGVPRDDSPRLISSQDLPEGLRPGQLPTSTPVQVSATGPGRDQVHMVQGNRLVTVERQIAETPEQLIEILLFGTFPEEAAEGIQTAIFRGTEVQGVDVNNLVDLAIVDLAPGSLDPRNSEQRLAFAQIVYTLTSLPGIESVQFVQSDPNDPSADPISLAVQTDTGTTLPGERVTRSSFALLDPSLSPAPAFDIPVVSPTPTPDPNAPPTYELPIYMLDADDRLVRVSRDIERTKEALLISLLEGPLLEEQGLGIRSAIQPDALPNGITTAAFQISEVDAFGFEILRSANIATVDLTSFSLPPAVEGTAVRSERYFAAAQIVMTLTDLIEIDQVVFSIDGLPQPMPTDRGLSLPFDPEVPSGLDRSDYASLLPQSTTLAPPTPTAIPTAAPDDSDSPAADSVTPTPAPTPTPGG